MKRLLFLAFIVLFTSCIKESHTAYSYYMYNFSSVSVRIQSYTDGLLINDTLINPNSRILFSGNFIRGKQSEPILFFPKFGVDSNIVTFDEKHTVLHMHNDTFYTGSRKTVDFSTNRSLNQIQAVSIYVGKETRNTKLYNIDFTFTEADYEFAKQ